MEVRIEEPDYKGDHGKNKCHSQSYVSYISRHDAIGPAAKSASKGKVAASEYEVQDHGQQSHDQKTVGAESQKTEPARFANEPEPKMDEYRYEQEAGQAETIIKEEMGCEGSQSAQPVGDIRAGFDQ